MSELPDRTAPERFMRELDWNLLRTFVVLAEAGSVTEAAQRLHLAQPSVSAALKRLEERLGKRLIDRGPGHFRLTEAGEKLRREAVEIQGSILRISTLMREVTDEVRGHLRIALASHVVCPLFDRVLAEFHAAHPRATMSLEVYSSADAIAQVTMKSASLAVCLVRDRNPRLEYRRLYREFFGLFCGPPHPLFAREGLELRDLAGHSAVGFETDRLGDVLHPVTLMRAQAEMDERVTGISSHLEEVRRMIVAGIGIGALPLHVAARDISDGLLWRLPPYSELPAIDVHVVWNPKTRMNRAEALFLSRLLETIEATPIEDRTYA
ncbi:LysR family transcriptional regulator [Rhodosalinus halophilus]|uniref:LysR family transcriptional regulator n=1 Tax=Rhodosalinus halophilus TaxID=2259333 RepID=A0A365UDI1_9RHOB|nr:LysR family transcriptional regulator [Rhodosalinus halophilus]RBI86765.1 LysR family transcriptional regulator [Rhodosalinus halophilus]